MNGGMSGWGYSVICHVGNEVIRIGMECETGFIKIN